MASLIPTKLLYLEDAQLTQHTATVLSFSEREWFQNIFLDQTIFYPQGGGQPSDHGTITGDKGVFVVNNVRFAEGLAAHSGYLESGILEAGDTVLLQIDMDRRQLHNQLHTAGHLIDAAMKAIGLKLPPAKGYHFPDSPYVEYMGTIPPEEREQVQQALEAKANELIQAGGAVTHQLVERERLSEFCDFVPDYVPQDKPSRVVTVCGLGCPCGGTHVQDVKEIGHITVPKIKSKGGNVRVSYRIG